MFTHIKESSLKKYANQKHTKKLRILRARLLGLLLILGMNFSCKDIEVLV